MSFCVLAQPTPDKIEIIRDQYGVPHVYAPTDAGVAYGLAWAHAEDDFETIQLTLLAAKGMLGQHLGKKGAAADYVAKLLRCKQLASDKLHTFSPEYLQVIRGYTAGINAFGQKYPHRVLLEASFPLQLEEVIAAYILSVTVMSGADQAVQSLVSGEVESILPSATGSNAFAFSRKKTTTGEVFLNINSHQPLEGPAAWYEAHLVSEEGWNALGGLFPGGATIFHGTNEYLGWAHTVNYPDKLDIYQLEMDPSDPYRYKVDDKWLTLEAKEVKLRVKLFLGIKISVKKEMLWSKYGPAIRNDQGVFALHVGSLEDIRAPEQWYRMNKATNIDEFYEALEMTAIPGFNIIYADREDNLFYVGNGNIPHRAAGFDWEGVVPGNISETLPTTYHPLEDLPQLKNPSSGYIFNVNNSASNCSAEADNPDPEEYDKTMGFKVFENNRSERFMELMEKHDEISWQDFLDIKYDDTLPNQLSYPVILDEVFLLDSAENLKYAPIIKLLHEWDRSAHYSNVGAAQFMILYSYLVEKYRSKYTGEPYPLSKAEAWDAAIYTQKYLKKHFKRLGYFFGRISDT